MDQQTTVKNVNILDLRKTAKETFDKISFIKNVNLILVSPETAGYLPGIPAKNINTVAEIPQDVQHPESKILAGDGKDAHRAGCHPGTH